MKTELKLVRVLEGSAEKQLKRRATMKTPFTPTASPAPAASAVPAQPSSTVVLLRDGRATRVSSMMYLTPPTTAIMAWILFGEPLTAMILGGTLVTMIGVLVVNQASMPGWLQRAVRRG